MFSEVWAKIIASILSFFMLIFGFGNQGNQEQDPPQTPEQEISEIKNVIYLIGDGMGFNHLEKTKKERNITLTMETFEFKGSSMTRSMDSKVTDSAAGATALACGVRTDNGAVGVYSTDKDSKESYPKNLTELCMEKGMLTGVITTDQTSGATPAGFSAHSSSRSNTEDITNDQFASGINLIWGRANGVATSSMAQSSGYEYITTYDQMMALDEGSYSFGQFTNSLWKLNQSDSKNPNLQQMAVKAVDILDDTEEGFFLMIEGAHIDKHSHNNYSESMTEALAEFDKTIEAMLEYAKADGETMVIITADHETGGITLENDAYVYTSSGHTAADVPVFVYGTDEIIKEEEVLNNYEIPIRIAYALGFEESEFPFEVKVN